MVIVMFNKKWPSQIGLLNTSTASLQRDKTPPTKQSNNETPAILELWGMRSIPSLPSLPSLLCSGVVASDRALSVGQIELDCVLMLKLIA